MPQPRKRLVSLADTHYYHCISRCVRRAFLCGKDPLTGFDFEHRRQWIVDRMKTLAVVFAVDVCAYAVMNNHYHVVVRINASQAEHWSNREVAERWTQIFSGPPLVQRWLAHDELHCAELDAVTDTVAVWRQRLHDLSWFMRCLNESVARMANQEDRCTGRFWEGRFRSQALLDERAVLACMAYVDLNPIRAAMATTPEQSDYTSIQQRIRDPQTSDLRQFVEQDDDELGIPFGFQDYLELVDWAGRAIRPDATGFIPERAPPILQRLAMAAPTVLDYLSKKEQSQAQALGSATCLRVLAQRMGKKFIKGVALGRRLCPEPG